MEKKIQNTFVGFAPKGVSTEDAFKSVCKLIGMEPGNEINFILSQHINDNIRVDVTFAPDRDGRIYYCPLIFAGSDIVLVDAAGAFYEKGMQYLKRRYNDGQIIALESLVSSMIQKSEHICRKACRLL